MLSKIIQKTTFLFLIFFSISAFSQENQIATISTKKLHFTKVQFEPTFKIVQFYINKPLDDDLQKSLTLKFESEPSIKYFEFSDNNLCILKTDFDVGADNILQILKSINVDFQYKYVKFITDKEVNLNCSSNKEEEKARAKEEMEWRKSHPQEWQEKLNNRHN